MSLLLKAAQWSANLQFPDIPESVLAKARRQILSVGAAIHAGTTTGAGKIVLQETHARGAPGAATCLATGHRLHPRDAIFANAALSMALDYDDYLLFGHTGHSAVLAPLAFGEVENLTFKDVLTAQVAANEIAGRLGLLVLFGPHNGQAWTYLHQAGAAAAISRMRGLTAEQTAHALAIALYQPTYCLWPGFMGPEAKILSAAVPAVIGYEAAHLAARGLTGSLTLLEERRGLGDQLSYAPNYAAFSGFGQSWVTDTLAYKPYPGCAYIGTAIDAVLEILQQAREAGTPISPLQVSRVDVGATLLTTGMNALSEPWRTAERLSAININFSLAFNLALALLHGELTPDVLTGEALARDEKEIRELAGRVHVYHDAALTMAMAEAMLQHVDFLGLIRSAGLKNLWRAPLQLGAQFGQNFFSLAGQVLSLAAGPSPDFFRSLWERAAAAQSFDLGQANLEAFTMPFAARVAVSLDNGMRFERRCDVPRGAPGRPPEETRRLVEQKWLREAKRMMPAARAKEACALLLEAPPETPVADLTQALKASAQKGAEILGNGKAEV